MLLEGTCLRERLGGMNGEQRQHDSELPSTAKRSPSSEPAVPLSDAPRAPLDEQPTVVTSRSPLATPLPLGPLSREIGPALVGSTLGHFRLDEFIGGGGMGVVFRAHDLSLDRSVAVKVLSQQQTEESLKRFRNEAQSAARLDHPHIARVYYVGEDRGWNYIVFEYIEGVNVRDLVSHKGPLSVEETLSYTLQIASAIDHAWRRSVIHRDIKPSNILVQEDGQAKLVDMGLARLHHDPVGASDRDLTASGTTLGTFDYISPEQARDPREADVRSDLYSLGCTVYFMLTGQPPFPEGTVLQKLLSHSSERPADLREFRSDLPAALVGLVDRLLAKRPIDRFQTPDDLIAALLRIADDQGIALADPLWRHRVRSNPRSPARWERSVPWLIGVAIVAAIAVLSESFPASGPEESFPAIEVAATGTDANSAKTQPAPVAEASEDGEPVVPEDRSDPSPPVQETQKPVAAEEAGETGQDPSATEANTADPASTVPSEPTVIQVGPFEKDAVGRRGFAALPEALEYAVTHDSVKEIVLAWDGVQEIPPQLRNWRQLRDRRLTLRAAEGHRVTLSVTPGEDGGLQGLEPAMVQLGPAQWIFEGIHWVWHLDSTLQARQGWSLFELTGATELSWRDCTITVSNVDEQGYQVHPNVAVFRVTPSEPNGMESDHAASDPSLGPQVWMERCLVRGEAALLCHQAAESLLFSWRQGILVTPDRAVVVDAVPSFADTPVGRMELLFEDVLLFPAGGLVLTRQAMLGERIPELALHLVHCVVAVETADPPIALFDQRGVESSRWRPPEFTGRRNRYGNTEVVLRVTYAEVDQPPREYRLEDLRMKPPSWYGEELPQPLLRNPWTPWRTAASRLDKADLIEGDEQQRTLRMLQFDPTLWDSLPDTRE